MSEQKDGPRFAKNAPGPFYVANGECIMRRAPEHEAPDLMAFDEDIGHCYFKKQPSTPDELEQAARAVWVSCCEAVVYAGSDPAVLARIDQLRREGREAARRQREKEPVEKTSDEERPWWRLW